VIKTVEGDKKRFHVHFRINKTDLEKANQLKQFVNDELDSPEKHDIFSRDFETQIIEELDTGILLLVAETRFNSNHGLFRSFLEQLEHNPQFSINLLPGSKVTIHDCPHHRPDEELHPCVEEIVWEKT